MTVGGFPLDLAQIGVRDTRHIGELAQRQRRDPALAADERTERLAPLRADLDCHAVSVPPAAQPERLSGNDGGPAAQVNAAGLSRRLSSRYNSFSLRATTVPV